MSAISGKEVAEDTVKTLMGLRNDRDFELFYESITNAANSFLFISAPSAPRKRKRPIYNILQYLEGYKTKSAKTEAYYPETPYAHFKLVFFEAIEVLASSI